MLETGVGEQETLGNLSRMACLLTTGITSHLCFKIIQQQTLSSLDFFIIQKFLHHSIYAKQFA